MSFPYTVNPGWVGSYQWLLKHWIFSPVKEQRHRNMRDKATAMFAKQYLSVLKRNYPEYYAEYKRFNR